MIIIAVNGRQATLASRGELIQGNVDTIEAEFRIADGDAAAIWDGAVVAAVFKVVTPLGEAKYATSLIDYATGIVRIPRIPMAYGNAKLKAGMRGVFEGGNVVATNMVDVGTVIEGAGGEEFDRSMNEVWQDNAAVDAFLEDIARMVHSHSNKAALDEVTADLIADVEDNTASRHTHSNKATLDSLYYYDAEHPPAAPDLNDPIQMPSIDPDTSGRYLRAGDKYLRKTEDGGVIARVITTTKKGKKYLRFTFNWDPDLFLDLEAGRSVAGRPMYVDIPVEEVNSQQGGNTMELDLGVNSINEEIIGIQEDLSVLPDWDENDPTKRAYIANRTHWKEISSAPVNLSYEFDGEQWIPVSEAGQYDHGVPLVDGQEYTVIYDNQTYTFTAAQLGDTGIIYIGNENLADESYTPASGDFSFIFVYAFDGSTALNNFKAVESLQSGTVSFAILQETTIYHPLTAEYMPDDVKDAVEKKHTHNNQTALDTVSNQTLTDVAANTAARHSHSNKTALDLLGTKGIWTPNGTYYTVTYNTTPVNGVQFFYPQAISENCYNTYLYAGMIVKIVEPVNGGSITISSFVGGSPFHELEYILEFITGATAPSLTLPSSIKFQNDLILEANKHYQISIVNNIALWCAVDVEVEE